MSYVHRWRRARRIPTLVPALALAALATGATVAACGSSSEDAVAPDRETTTSPTSPTGPDGTPGGGAGPAGAPSTFRFHDVNHVLGTGQSLSLGAMGTPPLSRTQPYRNIMFDTGLQVSDRKPTSFVPLIETGTFMDVPVETPSSSFASLVTKLAAERSLAGLAENERQHDVLVSLHGVSGASYPQVGKGTEAYAKGLEQVRDAKAIATAQGKSYTVRAITVVHGESDGWQNWNTEYDKALLEWQSGYDADVKAITGQTADVPMFHSQYSAWSAVEPTPNSIIPFLQLDAAKRAPGKVVIVGPKYHLPYAMDGFHLTNEGYRWLGEYYAKAYAQQILEGRAWEPVRPKEITRAGNVVTVKFFVPVAPLVLDTSLVTNPGNFGFEISDDSGAPPAIASVVVTGPDIVTITLAREPSGANPRLRYAYTARPAHSGGAKDGPRGNLRDSDVTPSRHGYALYDWCVHFDEPLP